MQTTAVIQISPNPSVKLRKIPSFGERLTNLQKFEQMLRSNEEAISAALKADLNKCQIEAYGGELAPLYEELDFTIGSLVSWVRPKPVATAFWKLAHLMGRSHIRPEPRGRVLILAPWNYPLYLTLTPVIGALAAGNQIVLKPSELSPACSKLFEGLIRDYFEPETLTCVTGGVDAAKDLLNQVWDLIFFTGGPRAARDIYAAAAKNLTPVILELGGKSPAIFDNDVSFDVSMKRLMWGKFFNAGQTCVAPDYVLIPEARIKEFTAAAKKTLSEFYGSDPKASPDYARIIHERHFDRLIGYLKSGEIISGGQSDRTTKYIAPTLVLNPSHSSPVMQDEIFGPILPILSYKTIDDAFAILDARANALALYIFSESKSFQKTVLDRIPSGGVCINDCLVHLTNPHLPFGGVGESGIGAYHGYESFRAFSHFRAVESKPLWADIGLRYPPYKIKLNRVLKWFV